MKFESKFDNGQEVWIVQYKEHYQIIRCLTCESTGKIFLKEQEFICPGCEGRSSRRNYVGQKYYVDVRGIVGQVEIRNRSSGYDEGLEINYMIDSTGVGSGSVYKEEKVFASRDEAQTYCDRRNGNIPVDEKVGLPIPEASWR